MSRNAPPLRFELAVAEAFRDLLDEAQFTSDGIGQYIATTETFVVNDRTVPRVFRRTNNGTRPDTFIRLFFLGVPVALEQAARAFAPHPLEDFARAGFITISDSEVSPLIQVVPDEGGRLLFDPAGLNSEMDSDHVMGIGPSSNEVGLMMPGHFERAADLGTGCGGLAVRWARRCARVLATDINPRAVLMARLNAVVNRVDALEVREGSLFEPLRGEQFDFISMNPPFVLAPDRKFIFRDGGFDGDGFVQAVIRGAPAHLVPGGFLRMTVAWACVKGQRWQDRIRSWIPAGCDAWITTRIKQSVPTYVESWIHESEGLKGDAYRLRFNHWAESLEESGIEEIRTGLLCMRRRPESAPGGSAATWFEAAEDIDGADHTGGLLLDRFFATRDALGGLTDDELLDLPFRVAPDARFVQDTYSVGEGWVPESVVLKMTRGFHYRVAIDGRIAGVLAYCNGVRTLRSLADELAISLGASFEQLYGAVAKGSRRLAELGFLLPPGVEAFDVSDDRKPVTTMV
ncbi:MAG: class I SAM-dependent methyltransferase [Myxococcales bacterium]|nr:class I SAM-dependent methyltransferase [Myxococcales bacterium]